MLAFLSSMVRRHINTHWQDLPPVQWLRYHFPLPERYRSLILVQVDPTHASWPKPKEYKQKQYCNKFKGFKNDLLKKVRKKAIL